MSNLDEFVATRTPVWSELELLVAQAGRNPAHLGSDGVHRLGADYRSVVADLAIARRRFAGTPIVSRLERLVLAARPLVYRTSSTTSVRDFVTRGFWWRVRERPVMLVICLLLLFVPAGLAGYWAWRDPAPASGLVPAQFQNVTEPRAAGQDLGLGVDEQAAFASEIFTNNIRVAMVAFAAGMLFGVGTAYVLINNGIMLGAVLGLAIGAGNGEATIALVSAHGVLELSCIVIAGLGGMRMGWSIVDPGHRPRVVALRQEARAAVELLLGAAVFLVLAGIIEGFVTPAGLTMSQALAIGFAVGGAFWALVFWRGRPPAPDPLAALQIT